MDILIETAIGDAHVSLTGGRHRKGIEHQIAMAAAMPADGTPNASEIARLIEPLNDLGAADLDELAARLPATPLPSGYRHFRLFNAMTGEQWHSSFVHESGCEHTLHDILFGALNHPTLELSACSHLAVAERLTLKLSGEGSRRGFVQHGREYVRTEEIGAEDGAAQNFAERVRASIGAHGVMTISRDGEDIAE